jgi:hypothetical protein
MRFEALKQCLSSLMSFIHKEDLKFWSRNILSSQHFYWKFLTLSWVLVAHACNPCYSGGGDQEVHSLKPAQANSTRDPISKIPISHTRMHTHTHTHTQMAGGVAQSVGPESNFQYCKKKFLTLVEYTLYRNKNPINIINVVKCKSYIIKFLLKLLS